MLEGFELVQPLKTHKTRARLDQQGRVYIPLKVVRELELSFTEPRYLVYYNPQKMSVAVVPQAKEKANDGSYPMISVQMKKGAKTWRFHLRPVVDRYGLLLQSGEIDTSWDSAKRILYFDISMLKRDAKKSTREAKAIEPEVVED